MCSFLHWSTGSLTFCKMSITGGHAHQRDVTRPAHRYREVTESTEEPPSLQPRIARRLNVVSAEQLSCTLRSPKWATIDETPLKGRTLPAAPSKKIRVTETCTRRCERKRRGKIGDSFPLHSGNANTRSLLHRKPPAFSTNRAAQPLGWYHHSTGADLTLRCDTALSVRLLFCSHHIQNTG